MKRRDILPAIILILVLATFLRFHLLGNQSFWNDEGNSARLSERSITAIIEGTASDVHPPLYYLMLRGWRELVGETEFGLRSLSVFAGLLAVSAAMAIGKVLSGKTKEDTGGRIGSRSTAEDGLMTRVVMIGLFVTVNPALVYYSQEARMYSLLALITLLATWALVSGLRDGWGWRWGIIYSLSLMAGLYTHYFFPAVIAAHGLLAGLCWVRMRLIKTYSSVRNLLIWLGLVIAAMAIFSPWTPILIQQVGGRAGVQPNIAEFLVESSRWLALGATMPSKEANWAALAIGLLAAAGLVNGRRWSLAPVVMVIVPIAVAIVIGATDPSFFKFLVISAPFVGILAGSAWETRGIRGKCEVEQSDSVEMKQKPFAELRLIATGVLTVAVLAGSFLSLGNMYYNPAFARADYRGIAARIDAERYPNAAVILVAPNQWEAFTYYHRDGAPVYPLPRGYPDPAILSAELERIVSTHGRIYALFWGEDQQDPEGVVERWLDAHTFKATEEWVGDVRFIVYSVANDRSLEDTRDIAAKFTGLDGEIITLESFALGTPTARAGDVILTRLIWTTDESPARPYKVFIHVLNASGSIVAQRDSEPGGGFRPTTSWLAGEKVEDNYGVQLPLGLLPGTYELRLGLYDAYDPQLRLSVEGGDSVSLGMITVH